METVNKHEMRQHSMPPRRWILHFTFLCCCLALPSGACAATFNRPGAANLEYIIVMGNWSGEALKERRFLADLSDPSIHPYNSSQMNYLVALKSSASSTAMSYIDLSNRESGTYNYWYSQFPIDDYTNNPVAFFATVTNPPMFSVESVTTYSGVPTNYFTYTPSYFRDATVNPLINAQTAQGGALPPGRVDPWNTVDYGWESMAKVFGSMEDLYTSTAAAIRSGAKTNLTDCIILEDTPEPAELFGEVDNSVAYGDPAPGYVSAYSARAYNNRWIGRLLIGVSPPAEEEIVNVIREEVFRIQYAYAIPASAVAAYQISTGQDRTIQWYDVDAYEGSISRVVETGGECCGPHGCVTTNHYHEVLLEGYVMREEASGSSLSKIGADPDSVWAAGIFHGVPVLMSGPPTGFCELNDPYGAWDAWLGVMESGDCLYPPYPEDDEYWEPTRNAHHAWSESSMYSINDPVGIWRPHMRYVP